MAKNGSLSISFQLLESFWDAEKKRSFHRIIKNLGTCKIYNYDAERMTQWEYHILILSKYQAFLKKVAEELKDLPKWEFLYLTVKRTIKKNDNYQMRHY